MSDCDMSINGVSGVGHCLCIDVKADDHESGKAHVKCCNCGQMRLSAKEELDSMIAGFKRPRKPTIMADPVSPLERTYQPLP